jgi:ketosteroid isomerase-like protein
MRVEEDTQRVATAFLDAFNRRDVDAIMALMSEDCVFESSVPGPDGARYVGQETVRKVWEQLFASRPTATFDEEEVFVGGDRAVLRWTCRWTGAGREERSRGVDILRVRNGKVVEKLTYTKR